MLEESKAIYGYTSPSDLAGFTALAATTLDMSLAELLAVPESDIWRYEANGGEPLFSAGSFVAAALRALGVFRGLQVNTAEFTVKDVYELDIYEADFEDKPDLCVEADYYLDFCQLFGTYRLDLPGYSTIQPYEHMNEKCPNAFENAYRPSGC